MHPHGRHLRKTNGYTLFFGKTFFGKKCVSAGQTAKKSRKKVLESLGIGKNPSLPHVSGHGTHAPHDAPPAPHAHPRAAPHARPSRPPAPHPRPCARLCAHVAEGGNTSYSRPLRPRTCARRPPAHAHVYAQTRNARPPAHVYTRPPAQRAHARAPMPAHAQDTRTPA